MELQNKFPLLRLSAKLVPGSFDQSSSQGLAIEIENEDLSEHIDKTLKIP